MNVGLEWQGRTVTFGEIDARSNRMARLLRSRGLRKGDRLCVQLPNSIELIDIVLACGKLGAIFVPINVLYRDREKTHILRDAEPALTIEGSADHLAHEASAQSSEPLYEPVDAGDPAAIIYTSGTTGTAKGAILTHGNFAANAANLIEAWEITGADRFLLALPLFHIHALGNGLHCWLRSGCRMRLLERFDHGTAADELLDFRPTLFFGVPTMYVRLLEIDDAAAREIGRAMRLFVSGSAPLPPHVFDAFREKVRSRDSRTVWDDRDVHEPQQSLSGRAPAGNGRHAAARGVGQDRRRGTVREGPKRLCRLLAPSGRDGVGVHG
jgi:malonyl-CoA/methylmalonyl-CoA synthetase